MKIAYVSLYVKDIDGMKNFFAKYFKATVDDKYENFQSGLTYCFLKFDEGARIVLVGGDTKTQEIGKAFNHFAIAVENADAVKNITAQLEKDGYHVVNGVRMNGYGEYESRVVDPEGNEFAITTEGNNGR